MKVWLALKTSCDLMISEEDAFWYLLDWSKALTFKFYRHVLGSSQMAQKVI